MQWRTDVNISKINSTFEEPTDEEIIEHAQKMYPALGRYEPRDLSVGDAISNYPDDATYKGIYTKTEDE